MNRGERSGTCGEIGRDWETAVAERHYRHGHGFWPHVVYSVMCLLFRGEKLFAPVHFGGQCASVVEGVIGLPLVAMFVLALNRRFKR